MHPWVGDKVHMINPPKYQFISVFKFVGYILTFAKTVMQMKQK
jgi:hypothetical protein